MEYPDLPLSSRVIIAGSEVFSAGALSSTFSKSAAGEKGNTKSKVLFGSL